MGRRLDLGELGLRPLPLADTPVKSRKRDAAGDRAARSTVPPPPDGSPPSPLAAVAGPLRAAATRSTKSSSVAVTPSPRCAASASVASRPATPCVKHAVAAGPEVAADDHRVGARASEPVVDRLKHAVGVCRPPRARRHGREDRDVDRPGAGRCRSSDASRPGPPTSIASSAVRVDVDGVAAQRGRPPRRCARPGERGCAQRRARAAAADASTSSAFHRLDRAAPVVGRHERVAIVASAARTSP